MIIIVNNRSSQFGGPQRQQGSPRQLVDHDHHIANHQHRHLYKSHRCQLKTLGETVWWSTDRQIEQEKPQALGLSRSR